MSDNHPLLGVAHDDFGGQRFWRTPKFKILAVTITVGVIVAVSIILFVALYKSRHDDIPLPNLANSMGIGALMSNLGELYNIAVSNNGSRTALTGYNTSVNYIVKELQNSTNYDIQLQPFQLAYYMQIESPVFQQTLPTIISFNYLTDFQNLRYGGSGDVTGNISFVNGGCSVAEYSNFVNGSISLINRNGLLDCSMQQKFEIAQYHGALGLIMINDEDLPGLFSKGNTQMQEIIGFAITYQLGVYFLEVLNSRPIEVRLVANNSAPLIWNSNIIAQTKNGDPKNVIIVGSHLDSVLAGPGMNDDGSGSIVNLELAIQIHKLGVPIKNQIRFVFFAAEEVGLVGSTYYVNSLNDTELEKIAAMLDFDMLGSPNYIYGIYNGSSANASDVRVGSGVITRLFEQFYNDSGLPSIFGEFTGRSDYEPFIENGIPAGGIYTGAEVLKTQAQRDLFGGLANTAYDPCYHLACDTLYNINQEAYIVEAKAAATVLETLALSDIRKLLNTSSQFPPFRAQASSNSAILLLSALLVVLCM